MSLWRDDVPQSRVCVAIAAAIALLSIFSLGRIFTSSVYLAWLLPAVAAGAAFALTIGRRSLALAFVVLVGVAALTLPALFARELTFHLLPSSASWRVVRTLAASGLSGMLNEESPVPPDPRFLVILWTFGLAGGFLGASWIVVARPLGAILTSIGLLVYNGSVGEGSGRNWYAFGAVVLVGAFMLADGRHRIGMWGGTRRRTPPAMGAPALAAACLASLAGPALFGANTPAFELENVLRPRVVIIKPLSDVKRQLDVQPPVEVMRVRATRPAYWRLTALDTYTGSEWLLEARPRSVHQTVPAARPPTTGDLIVQSYSITSLLAPWLPVAYAASYVDSPLPVGSDRGTSTLLLRDATVPGLRYGAASRAPQVAAPSSASGDGEPGSDSRAFLDDALGIVGRTRSAYEQAIAIQNHFRRTFRYDEKVAGGHDVGRLKRFLSDRRGYCEQFAATMTLMLRSLGVQARVGVGFLPGRRAGDQFLVTTKDAHAWVEALLPGQGWVQFDPTPGRGAPPAEREEAAGASEEEAEPTPVPPPAQATPVPTTEPAADERDPSSSRVPVGRIALLALTVLAVVAVPGAKAIRRRRRRSGDPLRSVLGAYAELVDRVADLGTRSVPSQTQWELWSTAFRGGSAPGSDAASRAVGSAVGTIYGDEEPVAAAAAETWTDVRSAVRDLGRSHRWTRRVRALFDPRTLVPR